MYTGLYRHLTDRKRIKRTRRMHDDHRYLTRLAAEIAEVLRDSATATLEAENSTALRNTERQSFEVMLKDAPRARMICRCRSDFHHMFTIFSPFPPIFTCFHLFSAYSFSTIWPIFGGVGLTARTIVSPWTRSDELCASCGARSRRFRLKILGFLAEMM